MGLFDRFSPAGAARPDSVAASQAPDTICAESLSDLELFMPEDDMATVEAAYSEPDAEGIRTYVGSEADRAEDGAVSDAISLP